jgi:phosphomannomutase/phosphoglucomutase
MYRLGHSLIKARMKKKARRAGRRDEQPPVLQDRFTATCPYSACRLMEIVSDSGRALSAQLEGLPTTVSTPEIRVDCPDEVKFDVIKRVVQHFKQSKYKVVDVDGVRVIFEKGWGLARASNTQPVLVMRFEAENGELLKQYQAEVEAVTRLGDAGA